MDEAKIYYVLRQVQLHSLIFMCYICSSSHPSISGTFVYCWYPNSSSDLDQLSITLRRPWSDLWLCWGVCQGLQSPDHLHKPCAFVSRGIQFLKWAVKNLPPQEVTIDLEGSASGSFASIFWPCCVSSGPSRMLLLLKHFHPILPLISTIIL